MEPYVLDRQWYPVGRVMAEDEKMTGRSYEFSQLERAFVTLGYFSPPPRNFFSRSVKAYKGLDRLEIGQDAVRGISERFVKEMLRWYDRGEITRVTLNRLLSYRQRFFNGKHPQSMKIFRVSDREDLQDLIAFEKKYREDTQHA